MELRCKHNWILILFNVSRKHEGREPKCILCHYKPFKLLHATSSPQCIPEYMYTHCDLVFTMLLDINAYF